MQNTVIKEFADDPRVVMALMSQDEERAVLEEFWRNVYLRGVMLFDPTGVVSKQLYDAPYTGTPFGRAFVIDQEQRVVLPLYGHNPDVVIGAIHGLLGDGAPGLSGVVSVNEHDGLGALGVPVDLDASLGVDSGAVTTESRVDGIVRLEFTFLDPLDPAVGALGADAVVITPDPGVDVATSLDNGDLTLVVEFAPPLPDGETYAIVLADSVVAAATATPGDRDIEICALAGNVVSESGAGLQVVNAIDIGLTGIRGRFGSDVADPANVRFDVNQDGGINALDISCVRLTCGLFGNTAP